MAYYTLAEVDEVLAKYHEASVALADGKEYEMGDRKFTATDAFYIKHQINHWTVIRNKILKAQKSGKKKIGRTATFSP